MSRDYYPKFDRIPHGILESIRELFEKVRGLRDQILSISHSSESEDEKYARISKLLDDNDFNVPWSSQIDVLYSLSNELDALHEILVEIKAECDHPGMIDVLMKLGLIKEGQNAAHQLVYGHLYDRP